MAATPGSVLAPAAFDRMIPLGEPSATTEAHVDDHTALVDECLAEPTGA